MPGGGPITCAWLKGGSLMSLSDDSNRNTDPASAPFSRRQFLPLLGATAAAAFAPRALFAAPGGQPGRPSVAQARFVYVGTYTAPGVPPGGTHPSSAVGIYAFTMNPSDGSLAPFQIVVASNPSFLVLDPYFSHLSSVNEDDPGRGTPYPLSAANGSLGIINSQPADGSFTTHVSVHPSGQYVMAANYGSGNFPVFPIVAGGGLPPKTVLFP